MSLSTFGEIFQYLPVPHVVQLDIHPLRGRGDERARMREDENPREREEDERTRIRENDKGTIIREDERMKITRITEDDNARELCDRTTRGTEVREDDNGRGRQSKNSRER